MARLIGLAQGTLTNGIKLCTIDLLLIKAAVMYEPREGNGRFLLDSFGRGNFCLTKLPTYLRLQHGQQEADTVKVLGINIIAFYSSSLTPRHNKLECLSQKSFFRLT